MKRHHPLILLLPFVLILSACGQSVTEIPVVSVTPASVSPTPASPSPTPAPRSLTVCLGEEPTTLYAYGDLNAAARSVLSALYDGPMDISSYEHEAVILQKIPSLEDGDAQISRITVGAGDRVVASGGEVVTLDTGVRIRPSGCRSDSCAITYDGSSRIEMDQMVVTFTLLEGLKWSDGEPLTAQDSIYSFDLASNDATPGNKFLIERTQTYEAADEITTQWWGLPGYIDPEYYANFWMPLPQHEWNAFSPAQLLEVDVSTRAPLGWGPYIVQSWKPGEDIRLIKNLNYFRTESGLPKFDELTFLFMTDAVAAMTAFINGECDILDPSINLDGQVPLLRQMEKEKQARLLTAQTDTMEWLAFGIRPASYDDGFRAAGLNPDRPDLFGDVRVRKAVAYCLDRQRVVDTVLFGLSRVPDSYLSYDHPLHNGNLQTYAYNPVAGRDILEQVGWVDHDNDPATPRQALGVTKVPNGTPLVLNYYTTWATQRRQVVEILAASLAECGIGLNVVYETASDLYAQGPAGPLFGRQFDLAQYAVGVTTLEPQCNWFATDEIPNASNDWVGVNISGYSDAEYDQACESARQALPNEPEYTSHQRAQEYFAFELPSIPLYMRLRVAATRYDLCGFTLDPSSQYTLAAIEAFDYGPDCR
jgi:peptide/nickel transport system substrate-binding protein